MYDSCRGVDEIVLVILRIYFVLVADQVRHTSYSHLLYSVVLCFKDAIPNC